MGAGLVLKVRSSGPLRHIRDCFVRSTLIQVQSVLPTPAFSDCATRVRFCFIFSVRDRTRGLSDLARGPTLLYAWNNWIRRVIG